MVSCPVEVRVREWQRQRSGSTRAVLFMRWVRDRLTVLMPTEFAAMLACMDGTIAEGTEGHTTDAVQRFTGRWLTAQLPPFAEREMTRSS